MPRHGVGLLPELLILAAKSCGDPAVNLRHAVVVVCVVKAGKDWLLRRLARAILRIFHCSASTSSAMRCRHVDLGGKRIIYIGHIYVGHIYVVQRSRWESRPLSLVGNGAGAGTHPIDRKGAVFPRGTGRFLVIKGALMYPFAVSAKQHSLGFSFELILCAAVVASLRTGQARAR